MQHLSETTYLHLVNCVDELLKLVDRQQAAPGPRTHDEDVSVRKASEVHMVAIREARLAGILPYEQPRDVE